MTPDPRWTVWANRLRPAAAVVAIGLGIVVLAGWLFSLDVLKRVVPGASSMKPNTAASFVLLGVGLLLSAPDASVRRRVASGVFAGAVALIGLLTVVEYLTGADLRLDQMLLGTATAADTVATSHPGRMAPNTALAFVLLAGAQLLLVGRRVGWRTVASQVMCLGAAMLGWLGLYGYAFQVPQIEHFLGLTGMAVHTAAAMVLLAAGTYFARPSEGLARLLAAQGSSATLTRLMLAASVVVPPVLGWLRLYAQFDRNLFDTRQGVALLVTGNVVVFVVIGFVAGGRAIRLEAARDHSRMLLGRNAQVQAVVDNTPAAIFMKDLTGRYALVNQEFERLFGSSIGLTDRDLFSAPVVARMDGYVRQALDTGEPVHFEQVLVLDGGPRTYLSAVFPLTDATGRTYAVCGVFTDITSRKLTENALTETTARLKAELGRRVETEAELRAREAELNAFARVVAHDLKGPLTPVDGYAEILADELAHGVTDPVRLAPGLDRIRAGVAHMQQLIDDLLAYATARDRAIHPEPVDLQRMTSAVVAEHTDHLRATRHPDEFPRFSTGPLPTVYADPMMCRQLLENLIGNAIKYTPPGRPAEVEITAHAETHGQVRIDVADHGIGVPADQREQVFEAFHRADTGEEYSGTGLGLAICRRIVDQHGGTLGVVDNPGGGSRFQFTLPLRPNDPEAPLPLLADSVEVDGKDGLVARLVLRRDR